MKKRLTMFLVLSLLVGVGVCSYAEDKKEEKQSASKDSKQPAVSGIKSFIGTIKIIVNGRVVTATKTTEVVKGKEVEVVKVSEEGKETKIFTQDKLDAFVKEYLKPTAFILVQTGTLVLEVSNGATATLTAPTKPSEGAAVSITGIVNLTVTDTTEKPKDVTVTTNQETGKELESVSTSTPS